METFLSIPLESITASGNNILRWEGVVGDILISISAKKVSDKTFHYIVYVELCGFPEKWWPGNKMQLAEASGDNVEFLELEIRRQLMRLRVNLWVRKATCALYWRHWCMSYSCHIFHTSWTFAHYKDQETFSELSSTLSNDDYLMAIEYLQLHHTQAVTIFAIFFCHNEALPCALPLEVCMATYLQTPWLYDSDE